MNTFIERFKTPLKFSNNTGSLSNHTFSVKDIFHITDHPVSMGLEPPYLKRSVSTASLILTLLQEGAALVGRTNLDPLCADVIAKNPYFGDGAHHSLGSSFGSAQSVADGSVHFSLGSDSGGSIRLPAASHGLYGFKASSTLFPRDGIELLDTTIDTVGIITKDFETLLSILNTLTLLTGEQSPTLKEGEINSARIQIDELKKNILSILNLPAVILTPTLPPASIVTAFTPINIFSCLANVLDCPSLTFPVSKNESVQLTAIGRTDQESLEVLATSYSHFSKHS